MNICDLNDDCLLYIFKFLTPAEKIKAWLSCERFSVLLSPFMQKCGLFLRDMWEGVPLADTLQGFATYGSIIESLTLRIETNEDVGVCKLLLPHCSALHTLTVCFKATKMPNNDNSARIQDELCQVITSLSTLKVLRILYSNISGKHLSSLTNLRELSLACSNRLEPRYLEKVLRVNPHLTKLNVTKCRLLFSGFHFPLYMQKGMESLVIDQINYPGLIAEYMKNIQSFSTSWRNLDGNLLRPFSFLQALARCRGHALRTLEIDAYQAQLNNEVFQHIASFPNLTRLSLKWLRNVAKTGFLTKISHACKMLEELLIWDVAKINSEDVLTCVYNLKYLRRLLTYTSNWFDSDVFRKLVEIRRHNHFASGPLQIIFVDVFHKSGIYTEDEYGEFPEFKCNHVQVIVCGYEPEALM